MQATRVARGARIARIARVARLAKVARVARLATAIRSKQGLNFLKLDNGNQETPAFNQSLFIGVPLLLIGFVLASSFITNSEVGKLQATIQQAINEAQTSADLAAISEKYDVAKAFKSFIRKHDIIFRTQWGSGSACFFAASLCSCGQAHRYDVIGSIANHWCKCIY